MLSQQRMMTLLERALDLVLSSRFWLTLFVAGLVAWVVATGPIRVDSEGHVTTPGLPQSISDVLGLDETTLEAPAPP
jgi:hypothetical protein